MKVSCKRQASHPKLSQIQGELTSTTPFYIDRRLRIPLIQQTRCLSPHRLENIPPLNFSVALSSRQGGESRRGDQSCKSCQLSPRVRNCRMAIEWGIVNTKLFKQNLKQILKKYYQIQQKDHQILTQKIQKQRLQQLKKISQQFQNLLEQNHKIYKQVKQKSKTRRKLKEINRNVADDSEQQVQAIPSLEEFACHVFMDHGVSGESRVNQGEIQETVEKLFQNDMLNIGEIFQRIRMKKKTKLVHQQGGQAADENDEASSDKKALEQAYGKRFIQMAKKLRKNKSDLKASEDIKTTRDQASNFDKTDGGIERINDQPLQSLNSADSGEEKFYKVIKQLVMRKKIDKQLQNYRPSKEIQHKQGVTERKNSDKPSRVSQKLAGILKKPKEQQLKNNAFNETGGSTKMRNVKIASETAKHKKKQVKPISNQPHKQNINQQPQKREKSNKSKKSTKKSKKDPDQKSQKNKQTTQNERKSSKGQKLKVKQRLQKGINYAKYINKMLKAAENDRSNNHPEKYKYFKQVTTRQAVLKKRNIYMDLEENEIEDKTVKNQAECGEKSLSQNSNASDQTDKKLKLTKYEEARLMYNMRNVKSREFISSFNSNIQGEFKEGYKRKRPSFCNMMVVNECETKSKSRRGSFNRYADEEEGFLPANSTRTIKRSSKSKFSSNSNQFLTQNFQSSLKQLKTFHDFDLRDVKKNIASYLRKLMQHNEKAKQLYNFLMYMQQSRKLRLQQQQLNSTLDQLRIKQQQIQIKNIVRELEPEVDNYQGFTEMHEKIRWNQKDLSMANKNFFDKFDARSIELLYWNNDEQANTECLEQCSLKQIKNLPI